MEIAHPFVLILIALGCGGFIGAAIGRALERRKWQPIANPYAPPSGSQPVPFEAVARQHEGMMDQAPTWPEKKG